MTDGPRRRPRPTGRAPAARTPAAGRKAAPRKAASRKAAAKPASRPATAGRKAPAVKATARKAAAGKTSARKAPAAKRSERRAPAGKTSARAGRPAPRPGRRIAAGLVVSVVMVGFLLIGVFPTRTWLAQREERSERQAELDRIRAEEALQEERIAELEDPGIIEQIARREFGWIRPGEDAYRIFPAGSPPVELPDIWPFVGADDWLNR